MLSLYLIIIRIIMTITVIRHQVMNLSDMHNLQYHQHHHHNHHPHHDHHQVMELSDMHNPTCKLHASQSFEDHSPVIANFSIF